jgi:hypothetical protein
MTRHSIPVGPRRNALRPLRNERGAVLALVVLCLIVFLGLAALAIDLGLLYVARGEAQRAADAGAHAGGAHMIRNFGMNQAQLEQEIKEVAVGVARRNLVRGAAVSVDLDQDDVEVLWDEEKVRVHVHRTSARGNPVGTLFARVLGFDRVDVGASAAAQVWPADATECVLPFAIPDRWCLNNGVPCSGGQYSDGLDATQTWEDGHSYVGWVDRIEVNGSPYWTGYSRNDQGQALNIKPSDPQSTLQPGWYFPFRIPGHQGASDYREAINNCVTGNRVWGVGDTVYTEQGRMVGPTEQGFEGGGGVEGLLNTYWDAGWDHNCNNGQGCAVGDPEHIAGRTRPVALFDPSQPPELGNKPFVIAGFAAVFVEGFDDDGNVIVYFDQLTGTRPARERNHGGFNPQLMFLRIVE